MKIIPHAMNNIARWLTLLAIESQDTHKQFYHHPNAKTNDSMKNEIDVLIERIDLLENRQAEELTSLREQFHLTYESIEPLILMKNTLTDVAFSTKLKNTILNSMIGLTVGYLSKKVLVGTTQNPIKRLAGTILQFTIANVVSKYSNTVRALGGNLFRRIFENRHDENQEVLENEINMLIINQVKKLDF